MLFVVNVISAAEENGTSEDSSFIERKTWQSSNDSGLSIDTSLGDLEEPWPGHRLIRIEGCKKACAFCDINRLKTKSGWQIKSYFKCKACDVPLCKSNKECFMKYHELRLEQPDVSPKELQKRLKAQTKPMMIHNIVGGADLQSYIDMVPPLVSISPNSNASSPPPVNHGQTQEGKSLNMSGTDPPPMTSQRLDSQSPSTNQGNEPPTLQAPPLIAMTVPNPVTKVSAEKDAASAEDAVSDYQRDGSPVPALVPPEDLPTNRESRPSDIVIK